MDMFQVLLLAAMLGWGIVSAVPHQGYGPPLPYAPANTTTAHHSHDVTIFAPRTQITQPSLIVPNVSSITAYPSPVRESSESSLDTPTFTPVTEHTQDSLQVPGGTTSDRSAFLPHTEITRESLDGPTDQPTLPPVPIVRTERSELSLDVPTTRTKTILHTSMPKAHTERPETRLNIPGNGDDGVTSSAVTKATANELVPGGLTIPATAHLEVSRTALDQPTAVPQNQDQPQGQPQRPAGAADIISSLLAAAKGTQNNAGEHVSTNARPAQVGTYFVGATPVVAGSPETTIGGNTYSVASSGNAVYVNGVSSSIPSPSGDSGIAAVIIGVLGAAAAGSSTLTTQEVTTQRNAVATTSGSLTTSASPASGSSTSTPAVQTTNVAAGLVLPGLGLGAVAFIVAFFVMVI